MSATLETQPVVGESKWMLWGGRVISTLPVLLLVMSGVMKIAQPQPVVEGFPELGYPLRLAVPIGIVELVCTAIYIVPQTAVLGAILLTGYLGGATASHVRLDQPFLGPIIVGVLVWLGLYLRDRRIRQLLPFRAS